MKSIGTALIAAMLALLLALCWGCGSGPAVKDEAKLKSNLFKTKDEWLKDQGKGGEVPHPSPPPRGSPGNR